MFPVMIGLRYDHKEANLVKIAEQMRSQVTMETLRPYQTHPHNTTAVRSKYNKGSAKRLLESSGGLADLQSS